MPRAIEQRARRAGAALARATGLRRVALIASADHGHGHTADGPYGFAPQSAPYDERIQELVRGNRLGELEEVDPAWAVDAKADSFWQLLMLHGAIGDALRGRAPLVRGADLLRDADRLVHAAGVTRPSAKCLAWRAEGGFTRRPRKHRAASRSGAARKKPRARTPTRTTIRS